MQRSELKNASALQLWALLLAAYMSHVKILEESSITCHTQLLLLLRAAVLCAAATQVQGDVDDGPLLLPSNAAAALPFCLGQALLPCLSIDCNWVASKTFGPTAPPAPASAPIASNLNIQTIALQSIKT